MEGIINNYINSHKQQNGSAINHTIHQNGSAAIYQNGSSTANSYPPMPMNPLDPEEFRRQGYMMIDFIADYYKNVASYPVRSQVEPGYLRSRLPSSAPEHPEPIEDILRDVQRDIVPGITHWQSPNHFAYFPSSASIAGVLGETLAAGFDVVGFNWISSPAATELETIVMDWLGDMIALPKPFMFSGGGGGTLLGTTCEAILCCVVAARDQALERIGRDNIDRLVVYASDQTHCSFQKSAKIAGILPDNFRIIPTSRTGAFALCPDGFRAAVKADIKAGLVPLFLCATVGTTSTTAVDPIRPLCAVAKEFGVWVHIDAAYAGNACICPEYRSYIDGVEGATSFSFNAHKWFLTTLDCCCLWVKNPNALIRALSTDPEYLKNKATESQRVVDYKDWGITLSRRFRALKLWMVLRSYGVNKLRDFIRSHVDMAAHFESLLAQDDTFEVVVPRYFANVCFRVSPKAIIRHLKRSPSLKRSLSSSCRHQNDNKDLHHQVLLLEEETVNEINKELLESINTEGQIYMSHSVVDGIYVIRFAVGASLTEYRHVDFAWKVIQEHAKAMLARRLMSTSSSDHSNTIANCTTNINHLDAATHINININDNNTINDHAPNGNCDWEAPVPVGMAAATAALPVQVSALNVISPC